MKYFIIIEYTSYQVSTCMPQSKEYKHHHHHQVSTCMPHHQEYQHHQKVLTIMPHHQEYQHHHQVSIGMPHRQEYQQHHHRVQWSYLFLCMSKISVHLLFIPKSPTLSHHHWTMYCEFDLTLTLCIHPWLVWWEVDPNKSELKLCKRLKLLSSLHMEEDCLCAVENPQRYKDEKNVKHGQLGLSVNH